MLSLNIQNSRDLIKPDGFKLKILLIAPPGFGKTEFLGGVPNIGIAACETGEGNGVLTIADRGVAFCEPGTKSELDQVAKGLIFKTQDAIALDSLTAMVKTLIRGEAVSIPRKGGDSEKRRRGLPELDDFGVMGVMTHDLLRALIQQDKHIIVTAQKKIQMPDPETGKGEYLVGPDLPGQMFLGAPAMFDTVLVGLTRSVTKDVGGGIKKKFIERYWLTAPDGIHLAKSRSKRLGNKPLLDAEELYDLQTGAGTWPYLYNKIQAAYREIYAASQQEVANVAVSATLQRAG